MKITLDFGPDVRDGVPLRLPAVVRRVHNGHDEFRLILSGCISVGFGSLDAAICDAVDRYADDVDGYREVTLSIY